MQKMIQGCIFFIFISHIYKISARKSYNEITSKTILKGKNVLSLS